MGSRLCASYQRRHHRRHNFPRSVQACQIAARRFYSSARAHRPVPSPLAHSRTITAMVPDVPSDSPAPLLSVTLIGPGTDGGGGGGNRSALLEIRPVAATERRLPHCHRRIRRHGQRLCRLCHGSPAPASEVAAAGASRCTAGNRPGRSRRPQEYFINE